MHIFILTFQRPVSLNRLIANLGAQGATCSVWSNSPNVEIYPENNGFVEKVYINVVNTPEASSWCARSWNTCYLKGFQGNDELVLLQDDTNVSPDFVAWIKEAKNRYDFMFGPAGDQFHYIHKRVLQQIGWWDERFNGCYCGDADYLKRVYHEYDPEFVSVEENHGWGFFHNESGIEQHVIPWTRDNIIEPNYVNQHTELEQLDCETDLNRDMHNTNITVLQARRHFEAKWGEPLMHNVSVKDTHNRRLLEIDWYPWASKKFSITKYVDQET